MSRAFLLAFVLNDGAARREVRCAEPRDDRFQNRIPVSPIDHYFETGSQGHWVSRNRQAKIRNRCFANDIDLRKGPIKLSG